ncbi:MAG: tRNA adenosine(34) deaminase TadA [Liquorilactobacillus ghanensis]|jgi:tRNA(adenine34) deaminase|uniref:tRNA-specific adenosine deaminase n=1 Tax=Liquorilactobacillus ghanensis DSM 18630 TaxID=1423750 RepID=A0A0R1VLQ1_9LACO|nr:tRNA adenosine(34) deaminase TadA [Liquorilactobacillus ghanensis]KRM06602.1 cytosine adenosine deaminase [Liquorilactobacillus ghanensis DSM 18630]
MIKQDQEYYMREALFEADQAAAIGEVPIGCVIVWQNKIIGRGHNLREHSQDATLHAEILAIQEANAYLKSWRLEGAQLFVTLEPCPMCSGAIINSRIAEVYYGAPDPKAGTAGTLLNLLEDSRFNHQAQVTAGILQTDCAFRLKSFFRKIRQQQRKK